MWVVETKTGKEDWRPRKPPKRTREHAIRYMIRSEKAYYTLKKLIPHLPKIKFRIREYIRRSDAE